MREPAGTVAIVEAQLSQQGIIWPLVARELGYDSVFLTNDIERYRKLPNFDQVFKCDGVAVENADTNSVEGVLAAIRKLGLSAGLSAIYTQCDYNLEITAEAARELGLPGISPAAARLACNKLLAREACRQHGVPAPAFLHAVSLEEAMAGAARLGLPCIVKPMTESASTDVSMCSTLDEVAASFEFITSMPHDRRGQPRMPGVLMEEYCLGYEVSVETVTLDDDIHVIGVVDKTLGPRPYFPGIGHVFPSCLPDGVTEQLTATAVSGLRAIGHDFGAADTDIRMTGRGPRLIEINARLCGAEIPDLIASATGIELRREILRMHLGHRPLLIPDRDRGAASRSFISSQPGTLREIRGVSLAQSAPGVIDIELDVKPGDILEPARSDHEILGHIRIAADTAAEAVRMAEGTSGEIMFIVSENS